MKLREAMDRARDLRDFSYSEVEEFEAAKARVKLEETTDILWRLPLLARKYGDDVNSPNVCVGNPLYNLARYSKAPICDCGKAMRLHLYKYQLDSESEEARVSGKHGEKLFLKMPDWCNGWTNECQICHRYIEGLEDIRWVCPEISCKMKDIDGKKKDQVLQICTNCIGFHGIITCGVCNEEKKKNYNLPCKTCSIPLCWACQAEWTIKCQEKHTPVTCPFCRSDIDGIKNVSRSGYSLSR